MKHFLFKRTGSLILFLGFLLCTVYSQAQYTATPFETGNQYTALTKDNSNNVYGVRLNHTTGKGEVVKFAAGTTTPTVIYDNLVFSGGLVQIFPWGIAVNSNGDVFVTSANQPVGWQIIKLTYPSYTASVIHTGNYYSALAVDASNNLYSMEYNSATVKYQLVRYPAGAESAAGTTIWDGVAFPMVVGNTYPWGIVFDSQNNIYVLDFWEHNGGQLYKLTAPTYTTATVLSSNKSFSALAIDGSDNIYTIEGVNSSTSRVMKYADPTAAGTQLYTGLSNDISFYAWGLAVTSDGKVFVGDAPAAPGGRLVQLAPPGITVSSVNRVTAASTNTTTTVQYTVTFSAPASNVTTSSFALTTTGVTGASIASVSGSGTTYTVTVNVGTGDGTIRLDANGSGISPTVTNVPFTTGQVYTIDRTAPVTTIVSGPPTLTNSTSASLAFSSNEAGGTFQASLDGGAYTAVTSPTSYTGLADGSHTFSVRAIDAAGNVDGTPETYTWTVDATPPNTSFLTTPANPSSSSSATFTFESTEPGSTFEGQLGAGGYVTVTSPVTLTGLADATHTYRVRAKDAAGNIDASPATYTWTIDAIPTVTSVSVPANGYYKAGDVLSFTVNFTENITVTGTPSVPVTIGSSTVQAGYTSGSGTNALSFSYTVVSGDHDMDGIQLGSAVQLNGGTIKDANNNATLTLNAVAPTNNVFVNTVKPTVTLSTTAPANVNAPFTVTITFSEQVSGFAVTDVSVNGATISNLSTTDNITYTVLITPATENVYNINIPANAAVNIGNNGNTASNTLSINYDVTAPQVSSVNVPAPGYYNVGGILTFTVNFTENIVLNTTGGSPYITLQIGSAIVNATYTGGNATSMLFSYTVVAGDTDMDGVIVGELKLNGSTIKDAAGNNTNLILYNTDNSSAVRVNTTHPGVTLSSPATSPLTGPFTVTITFTEAVNGFTASDITVSNATLGTLSTANNITYTVVVTPTASAVSISVPADVAQNIGNNGNSASNTLNYTFDVTAPVVTSVSVPANGYYKAGDALNFTVTFDENVFVTGGTPSLEVLIGSTTVQANQISSTSNTLTFRYTVVDGDMDMDGITINHLTLNSSTIKDAANNNANVTLNNVGNTTGVFVNTVIPTVTLSTTAPALVNTPFTVTITFSEAVTGLTAGDFTVTNGTVSNLQTTDNITYTVLVTPAAQGTVSINLPANTALNIGSNGNSASNTLSLSFDPVSPVITSVAVPVNGYYKAGDVLNFTVNFDESVQVTGAPTLPVIIGSTTVQAAYVSGSGTSALLFTYTVQDGESDMDGIAFGSALLLNSGSIKDQATNNATLTLNNAGNTTNVRVNTTHATVVLSTTAASRVNAPFTVTVTFSEAVTGLALADFTTTNATVSNLATTDNITYTVSVTPVADGSVNISLPADAAVNIGNNGTRASNTINVTRDATAPVITAAQNFNILQNSTAGTQIGQVTATDASGIIMNYAITSDPTGGAFQISATGLISVKDMAILNNNVGSTINVLVTVSDGLNTSAATAVAIKIDAINKAPLLDAVNNAVLCATANSQTIQLTGASAVEPTQTYTLSIASNQALFDVLTVNAAGLITYQLKPSVTSGVATITVTIKDNGGTANGGVDTYQRSFTITVNPLPVVTITSDKGNSVSKGEVVHLTATGGATYNWTATTSSIISGAQAAVAEVRPQANTTYQVTATSSLNCSSTTSISISTIEDFKVDATNVLTPNGDGKNDKWVIRNIDSYPDNELKIFDRSGRLVFSQRNYNNNWDGKVNGHPLAEGTYYYWLTISGGAKTAKGFITIILKAN